MSRNLIFYLIVESRIYFSITIVFEKNEDDEKKFPFQYCDIVISIREQFSRDVKRVSGEDFTDSSINRNDRCKFQTGRKSLKLEAQDR